MAETKSTTQSDFAPLFDFYAQAMQGWKQNYDAFAKLTGLPSAGSAGSVPAFNDKPWASYRAAVADTLRRFIEMQIELCRFYENRWRDYLRLSNMLAAAKSPGDFEASEASFVKQAMTDYANESRKLMQSFAEMAMAPANAQWNASCQRAS